MKLLPVLLLTAITLGCGYGSKYNSNMGGASVQMTQLLPPNATAGGPAFQLTVNGSGFSPNSVVYWGSMPLSPGFVMPNQLVVVVPASLIAMPRMVQLYVNSNGLSSNMMSFTVN